VLALGIDTSTPRVSVGLVHKEPPPRTNVAVLSGPAKVVARRDELVNNKHGEVLAAFIDEALREAGASAADLGAIGVGLGPGPFTGLRVGIMTAAAMSDALGVPAYGICSLDVVARTQATTDPFVVVSDARRKQLYWAVYNEAGGREDGPEIGSPQDIAQHLQGRVTDVVGPASTLYAAAFAGFRLAEPRWPDAWQIAEHAWMQRQIDRPTEALTPMYLRRPDAREPGPPKKVTPA